MPKHTEKIYSPETIRLVLHNAGYHGRNLKKKPYVSNTNRQKRLIFAAEIAIGVR